MLRSSRVKRLVKAACVLAAAITLSGCIVVPAYGPHYGYRPRPFYYY